MVWKLLAAVYTPRPPKTWDDDPLLFAGYCAVMVLIALISLAILVGLLRKLRK